MEIGISKIRASSPATCKLGCAIAILSGAAEEHKETIAEKLTGTDLPDASLSMQCFVYDAMLSVDKEKYTPYVLKTIEKVYTPMLEKGNNTVWETELGAPDFENAGSLCHGWSAMPIYYYHTLLGD